MRKKENEGKWRNGGTGRRKELLKEYGGSRNLAGSEVGNCGLSFGGLGVEQVLERKERNPIK